MLKYFIFISLVFGFNLNLYAQNAEKDNFFKDIKSIDLSIDLNGDHVFCGIRESDIRTAVGYTLSSSPLRRINKESLDILSISVISMKMEGERGTVFGCANSITFELLRFTNFKGVYNMVTVWSRNYLQRGTESSIGKLLATRVEGTTKEFVAKWAEQN